jgi:threonine-phosphate decarboxylase
MKAANVDRLFDLPSHNPSYNAVASSSTYKGPILDFCVPVNLYFPPPLLKQRIIDNLDEILRYYPDYIDVHQQYIAQMHDLHPDWIVPANGSTEIITMLCEEAAGPILTCVPTFGRWTDLPFAMNLPLYTIQRRKEYAFRLGINAIVRRVREVDARTLVISNPNNPTGASMTLDDVIALASELRDLKTIIIDESFIDFSGMQSAAPYVNRMPNLVVVKSLGKALGWHGVRLGYAVANAERARALRSRLPFWNINGVAAFVLRNVIEWKTEYRDSFHKIADDRAYMYSRLSSIAELTVFPSKANFLFVELPDGVSGRLLRDRLLARHGVMVRETSNKLGSTEQYLRLAVQGRREADILCSAMRAELGPNESKYLGLSAS